MWVWLVPLVASAHNHSHTGTCAHTYGDSLPSRAGPHVIGGPRDLARTIDRCCLCLPSVKQTSKIHSEGVGGGAGPRGMVYKPLLPKAFPPVLARPRQCAENSLVSELNLVVSYLSISSPNK